MAARLKATRRESSAAAHPFDQAPPRRRCAPKRAAAKHHALDLQRSAIRPALNRERMHDAGRRRPGGMSWLCELLAAQHAARHLEVGCAWENQSAVHNGRGRQVVEVARDTKKEEAEAKGAGTCVPGRVRC